MERLTRRDELEAMIARRRREQLEDAAALAVAGTALGPVGAAAWLALRAIARRVAQSRTESIPPPSDPA